MLNNSNSSYKHPANLQTARIKALLKITTNPPPLMQPLLNLYTSFSKETLGSKLSIILFFILPWNLGKHFEATLSYIGSTLVPYLAPTVYLQDMLVSMVIVAVVASSLRRGYLQIASDVVPVRLFFLFLVATFLSAFSAGRFYPSIYFFTRLLLYFLFFVVAMGLFRTSSIRRWFFISLVLNIFLLSTLGIFQFYKQSAVFNNYLFFGEQPYNIYTPYVAKESFGGVSKIPPYATFLHPNIFAGYLVVSLTLSLGYLISLKGCKWLLSGVCIFYILYILLCALLLFLTKSYTAWVALALGFLLLVLVRLLKKARFIALAFSIISLGAVLLGLLLPFYKDRALMLLPNDSIASTLSVERRSALLQASYRMFIQKPFSGWGINSFTYSFEPFYSSPSAVRFLQPVHNVFALIAVEVGVFGVIFYIGLIVFSIYRITRNGGWFYSVALVQVVFLSSFDHYFFTIPQTQLLFILTLLMGLTYTKDTNCL